MTENNSSSVSETRRAKKSKCSLRHWFQAAFFALTNGYAGGYVTGRLYKGANKRFCVPGLNCYSCPGALFACPIGALQATLNSREFTVSCYVFGFLMMVGAFFGRFVCGWMCPFGFVQDLLGKIPFPFKRKNMPGHSGLVKLKYIVLIVMVLLLPALVKDATGLGEPWFCEYICPSGTLLAGLPMLALNPALRESVGFMFAWKFSILAAVLLLAVMYYRPFCKYLCPLGAFYSVFNPVSLYRFSIDTDKCVSCGSCQRACGMDIRVWEHPNDLECIRCGRCRAVCPKGAITTSIETAGSKVLGRFTVDLSSPVCSAADNSANVTVAAANASIVTSNVCTYADASISTDTPSSSDTGASAAIKTDTNITGKSSDSPDHLPHKWLKILVGVLGALANVGLILYALLCMLLDLNSQTSGGGITWIALLKNSMFWILWFTGMAVSLVASVRLALASARSDKLQSSQMAAEALMLQICAFVLLAAGLGLWWIRYAYAAMLIIPWLTRVQSVLMLVFILVCCRDVKAVREARSAPSASDGQAIADSRK